MAAPDFFRCSSSSFLAHRAPDGREQTVAEHLRKTAEQAACDASFFGAETLAKLAGLTHDLGKYSLEFQERLQGKAQTVDHSTAGMAECCKQGAISAALAVAGHHAGLHVHSEALLGAVSLPLQDTGVQGQTIALQYQVTDLVRYFDDGGKWESLPGSFTGQASLQVNTSANQTFHHFAEEGEIKIHGVEATPSYTKIDYTIPFWGFGSYTVDFPRLYTTDGTPISYNPQESQVPSPEEISRDAAAISGSACFDGLPSGTEQVVLRFLEEDLDPYTLQDRLQQGSPVRVLAEVTLDFTTGEVTPSQTYLEAGMTFAEDYRTSSPSIRWTMPWDDPDVLSLGPCDWADLTAIPAPFQQGNSLWSLQYDGAFSVEFVTDGPAPQKDLQVTITNQAGDTMAAGTLPHHSAVEQTSGNDSYFHWEAVLAPQDGRTPQLLDTLTVTLTEPDSGETLYQRSVRLTWRR